MRRLGRQLLVQQRDVGRVTHKKKRAWTSFDPPRRRHYSSEHKNNATTKEVSARSHSLHDKLQYLIQTNDLQITPQQMEFCHTTLKLLSTKPDQGDTAEALLERVLLDKKSLPPQQMLQWYRWVMRAWALTTHHDASHHDALPYSVFRAHALLERMQQRHATDPHHHPAPDIAIYDAFLYVCATVTPFSEPVLQLAQQLVRHLETTGHPPPSTLSYNNVLSIWTNHASYGAASAAEDWLLRLSEQSALHPPGRAQPDTRSFNRVLHAWTQSGAPDRAYAILQFMMQHANNNHIIQPDVVSFATVLHGYRTTKHPDMAEQVFQEAVEYFVAHSTGDAVDMTTCLDAAMMAWAYSDRPEAVERVQALLRDAYLFSLQATSNHHNIQLEPTAATHRICLHAYLRDNTVDGMDAATQHLHDMIASCRSTGKKKPLFQTNTTVDNKNSILTTGAFHVVLQGWLDSGRPEAPDQCRQLLQLMVELSDTHNIPCAPETTTFVRYLQLLWKQKCSPQQALDALELAEERRMVNFYVYKLVLQILERSPSYAWVAYNVFQRALAQHQQGHIPKLESSAWHRLTMDVLLKHKTRESLDLALHLLVHEFPEHSVGALEVSYVSVLTAFARTPARAGPVAWTLYKKMKQSSLIRHNATIWSAVVQTMIQSGGELQYMEQACALLQEMALHPRIAGPDRATMDACIVALCRRTENTALVERAIPLLEWLTEHYQQGILHECPSSSTFRQVFDACHITNNTEQAQRIQALARRLFPPLNA